MSNDQTLTHICTSCLEVVSKDEAREEVSPCCSSLISDGDIALKVDFFEFMEKLTNWVEASSKEKSVVLNHIKSMSANSKKRRKMYNLPANRWPGRLSTATTKKAIRKAGVNLKKEPRGVKPKTKQVDIRNSPKNFPITSPEAWQVNITGKYQHTVYAANRADARKKARSWLRSQNTSIMVAESIEEGNGVTNIHYV